jgi:hypothetical protein
MRDFATAASFLEGHFASGGTPCAIQVTTIAANIMKDWKAMMTINER